MRRADHPPQLPWSRSSMIRCREPPTRANVTGAYADDAVVHDKSIADHLLAPGRELGLSPRAAVWEAFDSDASQSRSSGQAARAALISLPTLSHHGHEVQHAETVGRCARLLAEYLCRPA